MYGGIPSSVFFLVKTIVDRESVVTLAVSSFVLA